MKSVIAFLLVVCIIAFTGCAVNEGASPECVSDDLSAPLSPTFALNADFPEGSLLIQDTESGRLAIYDDYEISEEVFPAASAQEGLQALTGREDITALKLSSYPREEYRFSWTAAGEQGDTACCGSLIYDGSFCYALCIQCPAGLEKDYRQVFYSVLSSAELDMI